MILCAHSTLLNTTALHFNKYNVEFRKNWFFMFKIYETGLRDEIIVWKLNRRKCQMVLYLFRRHQCEWGHRAKETFRESAAKEVYTTASKILKHTTEIHCWNSYFIDYYASNRNIINRRIKEKKRSSRGGSKLDNDRLFIEGEFGRRGPRTDECGSRSITSIVSPRRISLPWLWLTSYKWHLSCIHIYQDYD